MKSVSFYLDSVRAIDVPENTVDRAKFAIQLLGQCPTIPSTFFASMINPDVANLKYRYRSGGVYELAFYRNECIGTGVQHIERTCATRGSLRLLGYSARSGKEFHDYYGHYHQFVALLPNQEGFIADGSIIVDKIPFDFSVHIFDNRIVHVEVEAKVEPYTHLWTTGSDLHDMYMDSLSNFIKQLVESDVKDIKKAIRTRINGYKQTIAKLQELL